LHSNFLLKASKAGYFKIVKELLAKGANVEIKDTYEQSAIVYGI
jgi:ankyrin repeat protein